MKRPFPVSATLTAIALAFKNPDVHFIADAVLPRTPTTAKFEWLRWDLAKGYTAPDTKVGRKSRPNEVEFSATSETAQVENYGLDDIVPNDDIQDDNQGVNPLGRSVEFTTHLLNIDRERRVAGIVFNSANYDAALRQTLSGSSQWSDSTSDPLGAMLDALDAPVMRPNIMVIGQAAWTKLRRHPKLVQASRNTNQGAGVITAAELAELLEIQQVMVGQSQANTTRKGQTPSISRIWGKHAAFIYRDRMAGPQNGVTYGFTAQTGDRFAGQMADEEMGLTGSVRVRVGERVKEIIAAKEVAFYFENCVA